MPSIHISVDGQPFCDVVNYSLLSDEQRRRHTPSCGHSSLEHAAIDSLLVKQMYPTSLVLIEFRGCPSSAALWDDYMDYSDSLESE
jgi:hypothetical protein